ncbi:hypothetical protein ACTFIW_003196 [Dictyostelium discoideum]
MGGIFSKGYLPELPNGSLIKLGIIGLENSGKVNFNYNYNNSNSNNNNNNNASSKKSIASVLISTGVYIESIIFKGWEIFAGDLLYPNYISKIYKPYLLGSDVIIFMIDSSDIHQMTEAKNQIDLLIQEQCINSSVFLVMANKQDQKRCVPTQQLEQYLELYRLTNPWKCLPLSLIQEKGIEDLIKWILENTVVRKTYNNNNQLQTLQ